MGYDDKLYHNVKWSLGVEREVIDGFLARSKLGYYRLKAIVECLIESAELKADTAEIGVASGLTSRIISTLNAGSTHWACDTFQGLADVSEIDGPHLRNGMLKWRLDETMIELNGIENIHVIKGYFPDSATDKMKDSLYKLVHIDVDTYKSTLAAWEFFKDRMVTGGAIVFDDVLSPRCLGAMKAWAEIGAWSKHKVTTYPPQAVVYF